MKTIILAAGYATRLYPLTRKCPKSLLPVAARPIIEHIVEKLKKCGGLGEILVVTNNKFFRNFREWAKKNSSDKGVNIKIINDGTSSEQERLGAVGDIDFAIVKENIKEDILVFGGDNLFEEGLEGFVDFALKKKPQATIGVYDIRRKGLAGKYGVVKLGAGNKILSFREKPSRPESSLIATCLYFIARGKLRYFKDYLRNRQNEPDSAGSFISWLSKRDSVYGFVFKKRWFDIGDPHVYREADKAFSFSGKERRRHEEA